MEEADLRPEKEGTERVEEAGVGWSCWAEPWRSERGFAGERV